MPVFDQFEMSFTREDTSEIVFVLFSYRPGYVSTWWEPGEDARTEVLDSYMDDGDPIELSEDEKEWLPERMVAFARLALEIEKDLYHYESDEESPEEWGGCDLPF